jgi:hypothetical protein
MVSRTSRLVLVMLALGAVSFLLLKASGTLAQKSEPRSTMTWQESDDDGHKMRIELRGKAEFTENYTDIRDISADGYVRIEEDRDGQSRRYEVRRDSKGELQRLYYLNGQSHPLDQDARNWLAKIVLNAVRQSGIDADKRVQTIMRERGVNGVLEEIALISGDYAKGIYFKALIKNGNLNSAGLQNVLREAARQITSDYEQAQLLIGVAPMVTANEAALPAFFEATATIKSDYERKRVLTALLKDNAPTRQMLVSVVKSAADMSSAYEKSNVLKSVAATYLDDAELRKTFFQTVDTIGSDYERHGVLSSLLKNGRLNEEVLSGMLGSASRISSDYEKATFLIEASNAYTGNDPRLRQFFHQAVKTIKSDYERDRVLSALLKNKQTI